MIGDLSEERNDRIEESNEDPGQSKAGRSIDCPDEFGARFPSWSVLTRTNFLPACVHVWLASEHSRPWLARCGSSKECVISLWAPVPSGKKVIITYRKTNAMRVWRCYRPSQVN